MQADTAIVIKGDSLRGTSSRDYFEQLLRQPGGVSSSRKNSVRA